MRVKLTSGARSERCLSVMAAPNLSVMAASNLSVMAALVAAIHPQSVGQWQGVIPRDRRRMAAATHALGLAFGQTRGGGYDGEMCDRTAHPCGNLTRIAATRG
jgi:hypothetical protein